VSDIVVKLLEAPEILVEAVAGYDRAKHYDADRKRFCQVPFGMQEEPQQAVVSPENGQEFK
jgi:hypothetical protein